MHDYQKIAAIVGEDKIEALRKIGVDIGNKPDKPTTGLLGRWVKDLNGKDMVICNDKPDKSGLLVTAWVDPRDVRGTGSFVKNIDELTFPEETTRPEDVPVGEAWLVSIDDGVNKAESVPAVKTHKSNWATGAINDVLWRPNKEVTLIAPLVPARPMDSDRERKYWEQQAQIDSYERERTPETVTTKEEYEALPDGTVVATAGDDPWIKLYGGGWKTHRTGSRISDAGMATLDEKDVLRWGWGDE